MTEEVPDVTIDVPLTRGQTVLLHLYRYGGDAPEKYLNPAGKTQDGIGAAVGISRAHSSIELKKQIEKGNLDFVLSHVPGHNRSLRVYTLTDEGYAEASKLVNELGEMGIDYRVYLKKDTLALNTPCKNPYYQLAMQKIDEATEALTQVIVKRDEMKVAEVVDKLTDAVRNMVRGLNEC